MFITKKRYEEELEKARREGFERAMEQRCRDEQFRVIHERIDRLFDIVNKPITVPGFSGEVKTNA